MVSPSTQFVSTSVARSVAPPPSDEIEESPKRKDEEIRLPETNRSISFKQTASESSRHDNNYLSPLAPVLEADASVKLSTKIIAYLSGKLNAVAPSMNYMNEAELQDYEQFAAFAEGGILNEVAEEAFKEHLGLDVESSEQIGEEEVKNQAEESETLEGEEIKKQLEDIAPLEHQLGLVVQAEIHSN